MPAGPAVPLVKECSLQELIEEKHIVLIINRDSRRRYVLARALPRRPPSRNTKITPEIGPGHARTSARR